jgi:hypothetical protein
MRNVVLLTEPKSMQPARNVALEFKQWSEDRLSEVMLLDGNTSAAVKTCLQTLRNLQCESRRRLTRPASRAV